MVDSTFISAFNINDKTLYARVNWIENETDLFHIQIYDKQDWWTGRLSNEFVKKYRERTDEEEKEYRKNVKASLMNENGCIFEFSPTSGDSGLAIFSWKNKIENVGTFIHGSVPVHKLPSRQNADSIIDFLLDENKKLKDLISNHEMNILMLNGELEHSKNDLEKFMNVKSSLEMSVYGKFISLLNSKKRRIQLLEENLQDLEKCDISRQIELD